MYPLGVMFGLGFDTSSEIALLGISSIQAAKGTSMWLILIFPILFTGTFSYLFSMVLTSPNKFKLECVSLIPQTER